jgi:hypothetical protein
VAHRPERPRPGALRGQRRSAASPAGCALGAQSLTDLFGGEVIVNRPGEVDLKAYEVDFGSAEAHGGCVFGRSCNLSAPPGVHHVRLVGTNHSALDAIGSHELVAMGGRAGFATPSAMASRGARSGRCVDPPPPSTPQVCFHASSRFEAAVIGNLETPSDERGTREPTRANGQKWPAL